MTQSGHRLAAVGPKPNARGAASDQDDTDRVRVRSRSSGAFAGSAHAEDTPQ